MRIAQIAPLWIPVPPYNYGGTELVVSWLSDYLTDNGHKVTLFASGDSKTKAKLVSVWPKSLWRSHLSCPHAVYSLLYNKLLEMQDEFDIIHDHCEFYTSTYTKFLKPPVVSTLHHPLTEETIILYKKFPNINFVAISKNQKKYGSGINIIKTIYHGLPLDKYEFNEKPGDYLLWLSKIIPQKGPAEAIEVAKKAGEKLILAGNIPPAYGEYFDYRIRPLIDNKQIIFVGAADFRKKVELFKNAKAFLFPVKRPEPFGLVVAEAMATGTPVIAFKEGSMPELIINGKNGFLVSNQEEMVSAVKKINIIKRKNCRLYAEQHFNVYKMIKEYEDLYSRILKNKNK